MNDKETIILNDSLYKSWNLHDPDDCDYEPGDRWLDLGDEIYPAKIKSVIDLKDYHPEHIQALGVIFELYLPNGEIREIYGKFSSSFSHINCPHLRDLVWQWEKDWDGDNWVPLLNPGDPIDLKRMEGWTCRVITSGKTITHVIHRDPTSGWPSGKKADGTYRERTRWIENGGNWVKAN